MQVVGGLSLPQLNLLKELFSSENAAGISRLISKNIEVIKNNFQLLKELLSDTAYELYPSNSGNFTMIVHRKLTIKEVDSKLMIRNFLLEENVLAFPTFQYFLHEDNKFGFRVNLLLDLSSFLAPLKNCLKMKVHLKNV